MNFQPVTKLILLFSLSLLGWLIFGSISVANNSQANIDKNIFFTPAKNQTKPPRRGTPDADEGTGSRGSCPYKPDMPPLMSLVGNKNLTDTIDKHPSFWIYVPYATSEVERGEFIVQDGEKDFYRTQISLPPNTPGIVEIKLPSTSTPLMTGKKYRWYFEIDCSQRSDPGLTSYATLTGIVRLISPSDKFKQELETARTSLDKIAILAKNGIWYDTLTQTIEIRSQNPNNPDYQRLWKDLLSQSNVNKAQVIEAPLAGQAKNSMF